MENLREIQENEIIALKAIYCNDFEDLRNDKKSNQTGAKEKKSFLPGDNNVPLVRITLFPQNSQSQHERNLYVQIDLRVKFTPNYPNELPKINLENEKGLSTDLVKKLYRELIQKANTLLGAEMIYELCQHVQEFLYQHNKPPPKSFYEQRLENQLNLEKKQDQDFDEKKLKVDETDLLEVEIEQAIEEKRKMLHQERKKEKEQEKRERLYSNNSPARPKRTISKTNSESDEKLSSSLENSFIKYIQKQNVTFQQKPFQPFEIEFLEPQFYKINCIRLLSQNQENSLTTYRGVDVNTNEIYSIYEWKYVLEKNKIFEKKKYDICLSEMHKFEEEFKKILKLNNKLLRQYFAYKYYKESNKNMFVVQICMEYIEGITFDLFLKRKQSFLAQHSTLRGFALKLLEALDFLHSKSLLHRDLKPSSVFIENDSISIKLSDYGIFKKLNNLNEIINNDANGDNLIQGSLKSDLHQLGLLLLHLSLGEPITNYHPQIPSSLPPELRSFISICMKQEDKYTAKELLRHPFIIKADLETSPESLKAQKRIAKRSISNHYNEDEYDLGSFTDYPSQSRLNTEFEVIGVVGHGAFGEVLKVKNKLDQRSYAIKRIRINPTSKHNKQITREIKLLSRLNHENVVRYYSTWVEKYEEVINSSFNKVSSIVKSTEEKRKTSNNNFDLEKSDDSSEDFPNLVRFDTNTDDHKSSLSESSSDSDSNPGGIAWTRKENSNDKHLSSITDSSSDLSSSDDDISASNSENEPEKKAEINKKVRKLSKYKEFEETDDSVIFAENSSDDIKKPANKDATLKEKDATKKQLQKRKNSEIIDDSENYDKPVNRQFIYIQMEFCGGKTLKDLIDKGLYQNEEKVWCLFREILQGLNHIHEQGMIHRDLKPGNVLIDINGHAKIGDFGLATTKLFLQKENISKSLTCDSILPSATIQRIHSSSNLTFPSGQVFSANDSRHHDSTSLSGAVGTALYVAPELLMPTTKNKFIYTQKVDIYSLGIMFYEMCFPFSTNMERIYVIQNLRNKDIVISANLNTECFGKQLAIIKSMLNHDPNLRPSAKELLLNESIPRKADEIALDEMLQYSFGNKQSTNYKKILKAIFDQKNSIIEDVSFDSTNCKPPPSFKILQIRELLYSTLMHIFQKNGAYMIQYPLLTPYNNIFENFTKAFKLTDASGLVCSLPYNHRIPFARYLARSGCTNIKRYYIGKVFSEKLKLTSLHPREHVEASFDIVTSSYGDFLPEVELLSIVSSVVNSFSELADQDFKLVINNSNILNAIFIYCGLNEAQQKNVYSLLSEYNSKLTKSQEVSKENRMKWFKDRLPLLNLNELTIEKLLNYLLKSGDFEKVVSELKNLTKSELNFSKLAKEGINQLKLIHSYYKILGLKFPVIFSTSFVLPAIAHPSEYSGFMFQLIIKKKKKTDEYDILANGGRYDKLINTFRNKVLTSQYAVGVTFDFEKIVFLINEKSKQTMYRSELAICSLDDFSNYSVASQNNQSISNLNNSVNGKQIKSDANFFNVNGSMAIEDLKNRLRIYKQFESLNRFYNITTNILYEKFSSVNEMDEYCKKHSISSYAYLKTNSPLYASQIFTTFSNSLNSPLGDSNTSANNLINKNNQSSIDLHSHSDLTSNNMILTNSNNNVVFYGFIKIKSLMEKSSKYLEKKFNLQEFLANTNIVINNLTSSFSSLSFNPAQNTLFNINNSNNMQNTPVQSSGYLNSLSGTSLNNLTNNNNSSNTNNQTNLTSYLDFIDSRLSSVAPSSISFASTPIAVQSVNQSNSSSSTTLNVLSQLNITLLLEPSSKQQSMVGSGRKKLENQIITKINHVFGLFNTRVRIELIVIETPDNVIQALANGLHLEMDEQYFQSNWAQCLEKINNLKYKKQLCNFRLDEILRDLRYFKKSKVFILYSLKSEQFKLIVVP